MAAAVARALFDPSSSSSDTFEFLADDADTEESESDAPSDPELGLADYWTCIQCKNQKNNPLYRFCEKCYQVITAFCRFNDSVSVHVIAHICCDMITISI